MKTKRLFALATFLLAAANAQCQSSIGGSVALTSWNRYFTTLNGDPGWHDGHPGGLLDFERQHLYVEASADPHAYREATQIFGGYRIDAFRSRRHLVYVKFGVGMILVPSFAEYGNRPNYCWWATLSSGIGYRIRISHHLEYDIARFDYFAPQEVEARFRITTGFRIVLP